MGNETRWTTTATEKKVKSTVGTSKIVFPSMQTVRSFLSTKSQITLATNRIGVLLQM